MDFCNNDNIYKVIEYKNLKKEMNNEVKKYSMLADLALEEEIKNIKQYINTINYTHLCRESQEWLYLLKENKVKKNKDCDQRHSFNALYTNIKNLLGDDDIEIIDILSQGYTNYGWEIKFKSHNAMFELDIPVIESCSRENYKYMHEGQYYLGYYSSESVVNQISSSYFEEEIKESFEKFLFEKGFLN